MRASALTFTALLLFAALFPGCRERSTPTPQADEPRSAVSPEEPAPADAIDWSTATPESVWQEAGRLYEEEGPRYALSLLNRAVGEGVVTSLEADQVRAGFLFELGRLDEAFLALVSYEINADRPDLLRLRAEIVWGMGRYDEARRDYETLLDALGNSAPPDILSGAARLYDDLGDWENAGQMRERLTALAPDDPITLLLALQRAIQSEDVEEILSASSAWSAIRPPDSPPGAVSVLALGYAAALSGDRARAVSHMRDHLSEHDFDLNVAMILLRLYSESGDFGSFASDLRSSLERLDAIQWLDAPGGTWPVPVEQPRATARLLGWASALELGRGDRERARLLAERALELDPYDHVAVLQLAAVAICEQDIPESLELLNEAAGLAPPSDVRTRLRKLQFGALASSETEIAWDAETVAEELDAVLRHLEAEFPLNAFFRSARAELHAFSDDLERALAVSEEACSLPGAVRDMHLRRAYYLARLGRSDEAWEVVVEHLPTESPYLMWASALAQEAAARSDPALATFSTMVRNHLDPTSAHAAFFAPAAPE